MLFDLRSRGRRRTVQVVYLGLAILFGLGLVLFGVGTGSGGGGLLNAFTGSGSSNSQNSAITQQEKTALKQTKARPTDPQAWANLINARWAAAQTESQQTTAGTQFTKQGKQALSGTTQAYARYTALTNKPDADISILAARAYSFLGQYGSAASAWEAEAAASPPNEAKGYECLALNAYAAKQTRKGDLAKAKALSLLPKAQRKQLSTALDEAKTTPALAQQC